jgi:hypothetical protein
MDWYASLLQMKVDPQIAIIVLVLVSSLPLPIAFHTSLVAFS